MGKNYYDILGISDSEKNLQGEEFEKILKKKYKKLCLKWHPDRFATKSEEEKKEAEETFKEITEANSVLSDKNKRQQYDMFGTVGDNNGAYTSDFNMDDVFRHFAGENGFGFNPFGQQKNETVSRGSDKEIRINITLNELFKGGYKTISFKLKQPCSHCKGSGLGEHGKIIECPHCGGNGYETTTKRTVMGFIRESHPCPHCGGTGKVVVNGCKNCNGTGVEEKMTTMDIRIPYITACHKKFIKRGAGNAGEHNGINGDLYITYNITNNNDMNFYIEENNLFTIVKNTEVNIVDCLLGADIKVKHVDGRIINCHINQCSSDGNYYIINGEGLPKPNGGRGDLKIVVKCKMPKSLNKDEIKLLEKLKKSKSFNS